MKKILSVVLGIMMMVALSGCNKSKKNDENMNTENIVESVKEYIGINDEIIDFSKTLLTKYVTVTKDGKSMTFNDEGVKGNIMITGFTGELKSIRYVDSDYSYDGNLFMLNTNGEVFVSEYIYVDADMSDVTVSVSKVVSMDKFKSIAVTKESDYGDTCIALTENNELIDVRNNSVFDLEAEREEYKFYNDIFLTNWKAIYKVNSNTNEKERVENDEDMLYFNWQGDVLSSKESGEVIGVYSITKNREIIITYDHSIRTTENYIYVEETDAEPSYLKRTDENGDDIYYAKSE